MQQSQWRIRGLALTAATFATGAAAVAAKGGEAFAAAIVLAIGLLLWYAFYFVDRFWYHPLLKAAVLQGHKIEEELGKHLPHADLAKSISAGSPIPRPGMIRFLAFFWRSSTSGPDAPTATTDTAKQSAKMHSEDKLVWFYRLGAVALGTAALALTIQSLLTDGVGKPTKEPIIVQIGPSERAPQRTPDATRPDLQPSARSRAWVQVDLPMVGRRFLPGSARLGVANGNLGTTTRDARTARQRRPQASP